VVSWWGEERLEVRRSTWQPRQVTMEHVVFGCTALSLMVYSLLLLLIQNLKLYLVYYYISYNWINLVFYVDTAATNYGATSMVYY
jgi:hypothetical protein